MSGTAGRTSSAGRTRPAPELGAGSVLALVGVHRARRARRVALELGLLVLGLTLLPIPPMGVASGSGSRAFVAAVNEGRVSHRLRPLRVAQSLQRSSVGYSHWMLANQHYGHLAAVRAPRHFRLRGEVLARAAERSPAGGGIVRQWLASPSHRAVLLNPRYRFIGVGLAYGRLGKERGTFVTAHFGAR